MDEEIYIECEHCGARYTIQSEDIRISEIDEIDDGADFYPQYCSFCGKEIEI
jgi:ribosomal protein L20A (L18A)